MQILGIYLNSGDPRVIKNLKTEEKHGTEKCWYPFGNIENCHKLFKDNLDINSYTLFLNNLQEQQKFNHFLYNIEKGPSININCIVGKNGSGKSSLLALEYRIINNLACKIQHYLKNYNQDFTPVWASGFDAELYYEFNEELYQIKIENNTKWNFISKKEKFVGNISLAKINKTKKEIKKENILEYILNSMDSIQNKNSNEYIEKEKELLNLLKNDFFYTVGTNYSLYSNSTVTGEWGTKEELWMNTIFHKNDGYFTPIVLVPYKYDNCATIDTRKELNLAKERVTTLALLVYAQTGQNFIENFEPLKICYELRKSNELDKDGKDIGYEQKTFSKLVRTIDEYYKNLEKKNPLDILDARNHSDLRDLNDEIKKLWNERLFSVNDEQKDNPILTSIKQNTLAYLSYKTIKICLYYDEYKNEFHEQPDKDILSAYRTNPNNCINIIKNIINDLFSVKFPLNFTNLKIKQCITFLANQDFYIEEKYKIKRKNEKCELSVSNELIQHLKKKEDYPEEDLSYDYIFENLLPPYFNKELYYEGDKTLDSLSSGESQLMNSLSYAVYHIKNATNSNKIGYQYVNLVFDEAELYYHPEYQRTFIQKLLGVIERSNFSKVKSINITIVTHSPFIISDIPLTNLLCLKEGERANNVISKTLGANFYDLMQNQFFMESSIGDITERTIKSIINDFNTVNTIIKKYKISSKNIAKLTDINQKYNISKEDVCKIDSAKKIQKHYKITEIDLNTREKIRKEHILSKTVFNELNKYLIQYNENFYDQFIDSLADEYLRGVIRNCISIIRGKSFSERRCFDLMEKLENVIES